MQTIAGRTGATTGNLRRMPRRPARTTARPTGPDLAELRLTQRNDDGKPLSLMDVWKKRGGPSAGWLSQVEGGLVAGERTLYDLANALRVDVEVVRMAYSVTQQRAAKGYYRRGS